MPIYEYKCAGCEKRFEELIRSEAATSKVKCPHCGGHKVERQPSVFATHAAPQRSAAPPGGCGQCGGPGGSCPYAG